MTKRFSLLAILCLLLHGCVESKRTDFDPAQGDGATNASPFPDLPASLAKRMTYDAFPNKKIAMDFYAPKKGQALHRAVILIHGGGWVTGGRQEMADIGKVLSDKGFSCFSIDYTLAGFGTRWPTQLTDVQCAVRYIRKNAKQFDIDPSEIAAAGVSAGGHLSLLLGTQDKPDGLISSKVQAVGSISGVLDLNRPLTKFGETYRIVQQLLVENGEPTKAQKKGASPTTYIDAKTAPTFLIHGVDDPLVPTDHSEYVAKLLKKAGVDNQLILVSGMGHGLNINHPDEASALEAFAGWLKDELKVKP